MTATYTDAELEAKISELQKAIQDWAEARDLWFDAGFSDFLTHTDSEPSSLAVITLLWSEGPLFRLMDGDFDIDGESFDDFLRSLGYWYDSHGSCTYCIYLIDEDGPLNKAFASYFRWKWICSLVQPDIGDIYEELYSHFAGRPEDLNKLTPRAFEVMLSRVFQTQGYESQLGPGSGDGGVDISLWHRDPLGDVLTVVQAKRYARKRKISIEPVAALLGVMGVEKAARGIFVTTSEYLPSTRNFSARAGNVIDLMTTSDVVQWCSTASEGIIQDKSTLVSRPSVARLLLQAAGAPGSTVVHATGGYNMVNNYFALVIKETRHAALLMSLPRITVAHDGFGQRGTEVPSFGEDALRNVRSETVRRAKRLVDSEGRVSYWDGNQLYSSWDRSPAPFDYMD